MMQGPQIVTLLVGASPLLLDGLGELPFVDEPAVAGEAGLSFEQLKSLRDKNGPQSVLLLLVDLDKSHHLQENLKSHLPRIMKGESPFGKSLIAVVTHPAQVSRFRSEYSTEGVVLSSEDLGALRENLNAMLSTAAGTANDPETSSAANAPSLKKTPDREKTPPPDDDELNYSSEAGRFEDYDKGQFQFTSLAWTILMVAQRLGEGRPRPNVTSVRRLLAAILLSGGDSPDYPHTGAWMISMIGQERDAIFKRLADQYPVIQKGQGSMQRIIEGTSAIASSMTQRLREVLDLARRLATESQPHEPKAVVGVRHLLGAAVRRAESYGNVGRFLGEFGLDVDFVRNSMISSLPSWEVQDDPDVWLRLLDPVPEAGIERTVPTYASDSAVGPDWIGITREVEAMASLVSAWSVEPPLSIGLFGEWGSGKSFFMQKMKERVREISREARKSQVGQKKFGYYKNIVQVEFNAWHYVEGNLWASLVEHIFANLRLEAADGEDVDSEENIGKRLQRMLGEVREKTTEALRLDSEAQALTEAATKEKEEAERRAKKLEEEAEQSRKNAAIADGERIRLQNLAEQAQRTAEEKAEERRNIGLRDIFEEVAGSSELRNEIGQGLEKLGITRERLQTAEDMRGALREATDAGTMISQGIDILRKDKQRWRLLLWVLLVPGLVAAGTLGIGWLAGQQDSRWLQTFIGVVSAVSAVPAFLVGAWKKYGPKLKPVFETIEQMKQKRAQLESRVEEARKQRSEKASELDKDSERKKTEAEKHRHDANQKLIEAQSERRTADAKQAEAAAMGTKADQARRDAEKLARDAELLRPERRIATFIQDRAAAKDYRQHLGVPAIIRRDFEKLAAMFHTQRKIEDKDADGLDLEGKPLNGRNDPSVVNRIILYIDDLDRCPPKKVVEVLQAIHLLLAFPLFVVIVAVDARWMKRSLRDQFDLMLSGVGASGSPVTPSTPRKEPQDGSTATPDDYLEKIFQVPFWIRPLGTAATKNLVRELTRNDLIGPEHKTKVLKESVPEHPNPPETLMENANISTEEKNQTGNVQEEEKNKDTASNGKHAEEPAAKFGWSPILPEPQMLHLSPEERNYMISLSSVIGRSPRSVKRFVNCYRLAKMTLTPDRLARHERDGAFQTTMLLLGVVSGMSEFAPELLTNLRAADRTTSPAAWAREVTDTLHLKDQTRWKELLPVIASLESAGIRSLVSLKTAADHVDRFSFSPVRSAPVE